MDLLVVRCLELVLLLGGGNREGHADAAEDVVGVGLAVEESLAFVVTLKRKLLIGVKKLDKMLN